MFLKIVGWSFAVLVLGSAAFADPTPPRVFFLCDNCDQYQMAYTEDMLTQAARKNGIGVLKLGNSSEYTDYHQYLVTHPKSGAGGLTPINPVKLPYGTNTYPKDDREAAQRRKDFLAAKKAWAQQLLDQLKKLDKTKPLVLHFGNHGINPDGKDPKNSSAFCMYGRIQSISQCLTYGELGDMLVEAGLTGPNAPPIRIVGDHCFSGGVHSLAQRFPNVCSASNVTFKEPQWSPNQSYGSEGSINTFGETFWKTVSQEGAKQVSLGLAWEAAWATVPQEDNPGGTLSSIFYAQQVAGWDDKKLPTHDRLPAFATMERSFNQVQGLYAHTQTALNDNRSYEDFQKPDYTCPRTGPNVLPPAAELERLLKALTLNNGANMYRSALDKLKDPNFEKNGKASVDALNGCFSTAKAKYDAVGPKVKDFIAKNGNWAYKNWFRSSSSVSSDNYKYRRSQDEELANRVLKTLESCVAQKQPAARAYLSTIQTLNTLNHLTGFAAKATPAQKVAFRKKVECESAPLF